VGFTRSQREFVEDASYVLRDPLTTCRGYLELLGDDPEERRRMIAVVLEELDRMGKMVDQLELLAEAEQPDLLQPDWIDLVLFADELLTKVSALASRRWRLEPIAEGMIYGDRDRLTEAVMNLALNAVQHTTAEDTVAIGTSLSEDGDEARLWVRDTGTGISVSDQAQIFDRFTRGRDAHLRYRGAGLGLAIVRAIAEAHGGRTELESSLGDGSTFTIIIPRHPQRTSGQGSGSWSLKTMRESIPPR
jgi:signal transduction histidine kinase